MKKKTSIKKRPAAKATRQTLLSHVSRFSRHHLIVVVTLLLALIAGMLLLPDSSPISLATITGKNTDRVAPKLDTLTGNYSVAGEAASTSLLVKYKDSVAEEDRTRLNKEMGGSQKRRIGKLGVDIVQVTSTESVGEIMRKFKSRAEVEYVEPNYLAKRFLTPDDSLFPKQWHLQKIGAPAAWDVSQGGYGPIAIIDTGIMAAQPDLNGYVTAGYNFVNDTTDTHDDNGHGTHVAGIVSAASNNGGGVASIGFRGALLPVKVLDSTGAGTYGDVSSGIIFAADNGAKIINLSLGGPSSSRTLLDAVNYARSKGVVIVAAAGNNGNNTPVYPAAYPGVVAVTASDQNDNLASFSSYGSHVYVSAPGAAIISTYNSGGYATLSGTSMATPVVSGLIGLALSKGTTTATNVLESLRSSSDKVGAYPYDANGWNQYFGYGRINAAKLLGVAPPAPATEEPVSSPDKTPRGNSRSSKSPKSTESISTPEFETTIEGTVDSIDLARNVIVVKVKSSSRNLQLREGNLIDLYTKADISIRSGNKTLSVHFLKLGDGLHIKAQWKDNKLNALEVSTTGTGRDNKSSMLQSVLKNTAQSRPLSFSLL